VGAVEASPPEAEAGAGEVAEAGEGAWFRSRPKSPLSQGPQPRHKSAGAILTLRDRRSGKNVGRRRKPSQNDSSAGGPFPPSPGRGPGDAEDETRTQERSGKPFPSASDVLVPGLYVVATPIGNAADVTLRALKVLANCDAIVAEDTRVTSRLLAIHGISRPLFSYNDHNAAAMRPKLIAKLKEGAKLALVSDAGTPLVSDPGYKLVREAQETGVAVYPLPGASAVLAALTAAGLPTDRFFFGGFLSAKAGERRSELEALRAVPATLVLFEAPQRLAESLSDMADLLGPRQAVVARELTKLHEEVRRGPLPALADHYAQTEQPKGEITLVIAPPPEVTPDTGRVDQLLALALPFMPVKSASALVAEATGASRREVYLRALRVKDEGEK